MTSAASTAARIDAQGVRKAPKSRSGVKPPPALFRLSEAHWQAQVVEYATLRGWKFWHDAATNTPRRCSACGEVRRGPRNPAGLPDLILIRRPRIVWAELKAEDGVVTADQQSWLDDLTACGQEVFVWKPSAWPEVEAVLR